MICERHPRLLQGSSDDVVLVVHWRYQKQHTETLNLKNFRIIYTISIRDVEILSSIQTSSISDSQQRSINFTIPKVNIHSGTYIVKLKFNATASNAQSSLSVLCPPLVLGKSLNGVLCGLCIKIINTHCCFTKL